MENENYGLILLCCMIFPVLAITVIAFLTNLEHDGDCKGFFLFFFGGLTFSTHNCMAYFNIGCNKDH